LGRGGKSQDGGDRRGGPPGGQRVASDGGRKMPNTEERPEKKSVEENETATQKERGRGNVDGVLPTEDPKENGYNGINKARMGHRNGVRSLQKRQDSCSKWGSFHEKPDGVKPRAD